MQVDRREEKATRAENVAEKFGKLQIRPVIKIKDCEKIIIIELASKQDSIVLTAKDC